MRRLAWISLMAVLCACAAARPPLTVGLTRDEVLARRGTPTATVELPDGRVLWRYDEVMAYRNVATGQPYVLVDSLVLTFVAGQLASWARETR